MSAILKRRVGVGHHLENLAAANIDNPGVDPELSIKIGEVTRDRVTSARFGAGLGSRRGIQSRVGTEILGLQRPAHTSPIGQANSGVSAQLTRECSWNTELQCPENLLVLAI